MDVIGAGFGRTGTLSLKVALEQLGFGPCLHMVPLLQDPETSALIRKAAEGDVDSLDVALQGYRATVDWPMTYFWRELVDRHPAAKVILTVRDPEKWYESADKTIYAAANAGRESGVMDPDVISMVDATVWEGTFDGRFADREATIQRFLEHNARVRREIPADRLLVFEVAQGWEPLCSFLGVPVPETPFPRLNDTVTFNENLAARVS
ncbi:sulfotransferase family protein [Actinoplanes sp. NPDC051411]|uniref:sulfotransferase family protein n=1 Tax=Actinoplanes sp. NPDC051411 TaxID=3155522 RepID=UPI00343D9821